MNLFEAIKSGRPFYRRSWKDQTPISFEDVPKLSKEAMIADDWEVADVTSVVTTRKVLEVLDLYLNTLVDRKVTQHSVEWVKEEVLKALKLL